MKTLENRIQDKLYTKKGEIKKAYAAIYDVIDKPKSLFRVHTWGKSGRHFNLGLVNGQLVEALQLVGLDFELGNDAPLSGKNGDFVRLTARGRKQVAKLRIKREKAIKEVIKSLEHTKTERLKKEAEETEKRKAAFEKIANGIDSPEKVLISFFRNEIHPAPATVVAAKNILGITWNAARSTYKL